MRLIRRLPAQLAALALATASAGAAENVLVVLVDDIGVDRIGAYAAHPTPGNTPTIDRLADSGVVFRNAWGYPVCSPARAAMMTGRSAHRTGIGRVVLHGFTNAPGLPLGQQTLAELVDGSMTPWMLGKWHLGSASEGPLNPNQQGFGVYSGNRFNLNLTNTDYYDWPKTTNGNDHVEPTYATTDTVDEAIRSIRSLPEPWLLVVSFNAAHGPLHVPPGHLHSTDVGAEPNGPEVGMMKAMVEAMDTELARLLAEVPANTTGLFLSDNGTDSVTTTFPFDPGHAKGTLYQGGIGIPLIVWGPRVTQPGSECAALVQITDIFATVAEIAGVTSDAEDSVSILPYLAEPGRPSLREYTFSEWFKPNGRPPWDMHHRAVRNDRYKLIDLEDHEELYDLWLDPHEQNNLLLGPMNQEQTQQYLALASVIGQG